MSNFNSGKLLVNLLFILPNNNFYQESFFFISISYNYVYNLISGHLTFTSKTTIDLVN